MAQVPSAVASQANVTAPSPPSTVDTAMNTAMNITEMLESMLQCLDIKSLLRAQRVCTQWQALVECMLRTNKITRKRAFLSPATSNEVMEGGLPGFDDETLFVHHLEPAQSPEKRRQDDELLPHPIMLNPWLFGRTEVSRLCGRSVMEVIMQDRLPKKMLLTQPPTKRLTWHVHLGEKVKEGSGQYGEFAAGEKLYIITRGSERSDGELEGISALCRFVQKKVKEHWGCTIAWESTHVSIGGSCMRRLELQDLMAGEIEIDQKMWRVLEERKYDVERKVDGQE